MRAESLSHAQVIRRYFFRYMTERGVHLVLYACSLGLLLGFAAACLICWRDWRKLSWLVLPWGYLIATIVLTRYVNARYLTPVVAVQCVAVALLWTSISDWRERRHHAAGASD